MRQHYGLLALAFVVLLSGCWPGTRWSSGDRVLVDKFTYGTNLQKPERLDVVVFKYPRAPVEKHTPKNYIKRLWGLPGEILAIFFGRVYCWTPQPGQAPPYDDKDEDPHNLWKPMFRHDNEEPSRKLFEEGAFRILRKPPDVLLSLSRIVYDNDYQAKDLIGKIPPRWQPRKGWQADEAQRRFTHAGGGADIDWLRYQHLLRPEGVLVGDMKVAPRLITDIMGYNSYAVVDGRAVQNPAALQAAFVQDRTPRQQHWVGDLLLDCRVDVVEPKGELFFELSKGIHRFRARWDLATGTCTLSKLNYLNNKNPKAEEMGSAATRVKRPGSYRIRFANVDARLTVWVDSDLPFNDGVDYSPPEVRGPNDKGLDPKEIDVRRGPTLNDLEPASIGSRGAHVKISQLKLWRDTYYTTSVHDGQDFVGNLSGDDWANPDAWGPLRQQRYATMYVQPDHYLVMGDNSPNSSDSREWGTVPERLLLGRALVVYYPFHRAGAIR